MALTHEVCYHMAAMTRRLAFALLCDINGLTNDHYLEGLDNQRHFPDNTMLAVPVMGWGVGGGILGGCSADLNASNHSLTSPPPSQRQSAPKRSVTTLSPLCLTMFVKLDR